MSEAQKEKRKINVLLDVTNFMDICVLINLSCQKSALPSRFFES